MFIGIARDELKTMKCKTLISIYQNGYEVYPYPNAYSRVSLVFCCRGKNAASSHIAWRL